MPSTAEPEISAPRNPAEDAVSSFDFVNAWHAVRKYWTTALATTLALIVATAFYTFGQTKIYEATTIILFDPNPPRPLGGRIEQVVELGSGPVYDPQEYYETQYHIIQSMKVALAVVAELGLNRDPGFLRNLPAGAPAPSSFHPTTDEIAAEVLRGRLKVDPVKGSRLATIHYTDANPERAARVLSSIVDTYVAQNLDDALASTASAADWLRGQLDKLKVDLESNEMALHDYKLRNNILSVAFDDQSNMLREEMTQLNQALTQVRTHREEVAARRAQLAAVKEDPNRLPASEFLQSSLLQTLRQRYIEADRDHDALVASGKGPNHPDVQAANAKLAVSKAALLAEVKNIQDALARDLAGIEQQERGLSRLYDRAKSQALQLNLLEIEYNRLRRSKENTEKLYSLVLERTKESDLTRMLRVNNIRIIDRPRIPRAPVRPNVPMNMGAGIVIGILLGIGAAMGRVLLDRTLKTPSDVEQILRAPFLGLIPEVEGRASGRKLRKRHVKGPAGSAPELVVHEAPMSGIAEAARSIRTNLMFMAPDKPYRTLLVTSGGPSEGKTTVACCIAIAIAQTGKRVALVDCDLRRPRIHRIFGVGSSVGLTTALVDSDQGERAVVYETSLPNLSVVPAGPIPPNPAELLQSERFRTYLKRLSTDFDQVVLDSPPLVAVTDATVLSAVVDGTMVVVRAFETRKELAQHAVRGLRDVGATIAGVVLNAVNLARDEYRYAYQYYRRYNYYSSEPAVGGSPSPPAA